MSVPATLAVRPGSRDASFRITTGLVAGTVQAAIDASNATTTPLGDGSTRVPIAARSASLTVVPLEVTSLQLGSALATTVAAFGGRAVPGTVILNGPAPSGGVAIALLTSNDALAPVPRLSISAGRDRASFSFVTASVNAVTRVTIGAAVNARFSVDGTSNTLLLPEPQSSAEVVLVPIPQLRSVSAAPSPVTGGQALTLALDVLIAGGGGINVPAPVATAHISVDRPELVQLPATLSVPGFLLTAVPRGTAVTGTTSPPTTDQTVTITVTLEGRSASTTVLVRAATPSGV
ncbi:MAG: hypothetical protein L0271_05505 [Gemmatimonadetes bacterium]|nr:hypothetical protein [Gemmatimonadota bacterium]